MKDLSNYRRSYEKDRLTMQNLPEQPMELFKRWLAEAENVHETAEVNAMTIATIGLDGFPKSRVVLLKQLTPEGFIFFTNYASEKGKAIEAHPNVCLSFFWPGPERQVIAKGRAIKTPEPLSDTYFRSRPLSSQMGALASPQSEVIASRASLEHQMAELAKEYVDKPVQRPPHWGGYLVVPVEIEFWQGRQDRLHDRIRYRNVDGALWVMERLAP